MIKMAVNNQSWWHHTPRPKMQQRTGFARYKVRIYPASIRCRWLINGVEQPSDNCQAEMTKIIVSL
jgi:hypothetical protein